MHAMPSEQAVERQAHCRRPLEPIPTGCGGNGLRGERKLSDFFLAKEVVACELNLLGHFDAGKEHSNASLRRFVGLDPALRRPSCGTHLPSDHSKGEMMQRPSACFCFLSLPQSAFSMDASSIHAARVGMGSVSAVSCPTLRSGAEAWRGECTDRTRSTNPRPKGAKHEVGSPEHRSGARSRGRSFGARRGPPLVPPAYSTRRTHTSRHSAYMRLSVTQGSGGKYERVLSAHHIARAGSCRQRTRRRRAECSFGHHQFPLHNHGHAFLCSSGSRPMCPCWHRLGLPQSV